MSDKTALQKVALSVAGSDPSGGAGIQADLKTFNSIGVYGSAVISCLTVQNTQGVFAVETVAPDLIRNQIASVLSDLEVTHIKIGMLGSAAVAKCICEILAGFPGEIICDPVQISSGGQQLIDKTGYETVKTQLLEICTVVTPNLPELISLTGHNCSNKDALIKAAEMLLDEYGKLRSVIVTGGHFNLQENIITDFLITSSGKSQQADCQEISHPRIVSRNTHGTGCTFSAAFTAFHLLTGKDSLAFQRTTRYMDDLIRKSVTGRIGQGTGPLMHHLK